MFYTNLQYTGYIFFESLQVQQLSLSSTKLLLQLLWQVNKTSETIMPAWAQLKSESAACHAPMGACLLQRIKDFMPLINSTPCQDSRELRVDR